MFACICAAVDEHQIRAAVEQGAETVGAIGCATGAGTGCGSCHRRIQSLLERHRDGCPSADGLLDQHAGHLVVV